MSRRDVWCYLLLIELFWTRICESKIDLEVRVSVFRYTLSPPELHFVFPRFSWTPMAPRRAEMLILTPSWSFGFGFGFLNWNERFWVFRVKKDERKLRNERWWYGGWDDAEDAELEKWRGNLGIEDGADSECTKMIKLLLKVDSHISHCWVSKILLCWDGKPKAQLSL